MSLISVRPLVGLILILGAASGSLLRIAGGSSTTPGQFPSVVSLQNSGSHFCAGTIVDANHVVTAAHCATGQTPGDITVVAGAWNNQIAESTQERVAVSAIVSNPNYTTSATGDPGLNDVAVLVLSTSLTFNTYVQPASLSAAGQTPSVGTMCTVVGWGGSAPLSALSPTYTPSPTLLKLKTKIISKLFCELSYLDNRAQLATNLCSSSKNLLTGRLVSGTCQGDSGGPLYCPDSTGSTYVAGIVSYGFVACGILPDVFTDVGQVRPFIDTTVSST